MTNRLFIFYYLRAKKKRKVKHGLKKKKKITQIIVDQNCDSFVETTRCWITFQFNKTKKKVILRGSLNVAAASSSSAASGVVSEQTHGPGLSGSERQWNRGYGPELEVKRSRAAAEPTWVPVNAVSSFFLKLCKEEVCCRCRESGLGRALTPTLQTPEEKHKLWAFSEFRNGPVVTG